MSYRPYYKKGDWLAICDVCGRKVKASHIKQRWDGLKVCPEDWEPRQPQDFVRGVAEHIAPPWTAPESADTFLCTSQAALAGVGSSGCAVAGVGVSLVGSPLLIHDVIPPGTFINWP